MAKKNYTVEGSVVTTATVWWNSMTEGLENKMNKDKPYTVDFCNVAKQAELEALGVNFSTEKTKGVNKGNPHDSGTPWITSKSKFPYDNIFHSDRSRFTADEIKTIGNGSEVKVKIVVISGDGEYGPWISPTLNQMVVTKLEKYEGAGADDELFDGIDGDDLDDSTDDLFDTAGE